MISILQASINDKSGSPSSAAFSLIHIHKKTSTIIVEAFHFPLSGTLARVTLLLQRMSL